MSSWETGSHVCQQRLFSAWRPFYLVLKRILESGGTCCQMLTIHLKSEAIR